MIEIAHINFLKMKSELQILFKNNKMRSFPILGMIIVSTFVSIYKSHAVEKYTQFANEMKPITDIISDNDKFNFIQNHLFKGEALDFKDFANKVAQENYAKILSLNRISCIKLDKINITQIKITGLFWHDTFIFDFLEKIQNFSPGFINIIAIDINKFSKKITHKPVIKLEVICKIFQKV